MCTRSQSFENTRCRTIPRRKRITATRSVLKKLTFRRFYLRVFFPPFSSPPPDQDIRGTVHVVMNSGPRDRGHLRAFARMRIFLLADRQDKDTPDRGRLILVWIMEKQNLVTLVNVISQSFVFRGRVSSKLIFIIAYYVIAFCAPISAIFCSQRAVLIPFLSLSLSHFIFSFLRRQHRVKNIFNYFKFRFVTFITSVHARFLPYMNVFDLVSIIFFVENHVGL